MVGLELAVEQGEPTDLQSRYQPGDRDLRRVGRAAEHAFAEKGAAQLDAVEAADQPTILVPRLDRMGVAQCVQRQDGALDLVVDPRLLAVGASQQDVVEGLVARHAEATRPDPPGEAPR